MRKKYLAVLCAILTICLLLSACGNSQAPAPTAAPAQTAEPAPTATPEPTVEPTPEPTEEPAQEIKEPALPDGVYTAKFNTDSSMFHVNEAYKGIGKLTVKDGEMTIHVTLGSKKILNLFPGLAEDAEKEGTELLQPTIDTVDYGDGTTDEAYGFDIPVPYLDDEFDCALVGTKGTWYDHKVSVSDPEPFKAEVTEPVMMSVTLSGGSGRASVSSPCLVEPDENGQLWATVEWSSPNYEFMLVDDVQYDPINTEGNSTFKIPVVLDDEMPVSAQTVAMSTPHLVDYTLRFDSASMVKP